VIFLQLVVKNEFWRKAPPYMGGITATPKEAGFTDCVYCFWLYNHIVTVFINEIACKLIAIKIGEQIIILRS